MNRKLLRATITAFLLLVIPQAAVRADMGPKPTLAFHFEFPSADHRIEDAELILCADILCESVSTEKSGVPFYNGPWINCEDHGPDECIALVYENPIRYKLTITYQGRKLESNPFARTAFSGVYRVVVEPDGLQVEEIEPTLEMLGGTAAIFGFGISLLFNLIVEGSLALLLFLILGKPKLALWMLAANVLSLSVIWFPLRLLVIPAGLFPWISELLVLLAEGAILFPVAKKYQVHPLLMGILILVANGMTFGVGILIKIIF